MEKMRTLLAIILTVLNLISLSAILYLSFMKVKDKNNLTKVIIVDIVSYIFNLILISSFCLTENECCESCCPSDKCCLCCQERKKENKQTDKNKKEKGCCQKFCDVLGDCCCIPIGSCIRKIGKHGTRYCSLIILSVAHIGMAILCFYSIKGTSEEMSWNTIVIVIICSVITLLNLFGVIAPCLNCCERLRYVKPTKKKSKPKKKENKKDNKTNDAENIEVNDNAKEPFLQKDDNQNNVNDNNNNSKNITDNSNNINNISDSNNNINKDENNNNEKSGDNFSNLFGIKREESNNTKGNK